MVVINNCDSLNHWSAINGVDDLDTTVKKEGTSSIRTTGLGVPASIVQERYDPPGTWNWGTYDHLTFWFRTEDISDLQFRIWSGANPNFNYIQWSRQFIQQVKAVDTWYEVKLYFDDYDTTLGAFNIALVDGLTVRVWQTNPATRFWIDYIRVDDADPVKVKIGSVAGLDYVGDDVVEADTWRDSLSGIGRWQLILENTNNKWGDDFLPDEDVEIRFDGVIMMNGYVDDVVPFLEASGHYKNRIKVLGRDYGMDLAQLYHTGSYANVDAKIIVQNAIAGSEITYVAAAPWPGPINFEFNRSYLADAFKEICKLVDYDFYVEDDATNPKRLQFFAVGDANQYLDGGGGRPDVDLVSDPVGVANNILRLEKGEKIGFSIKNYVEAHAGGLQDHWTDLNASDWTSMGVDVCNITDETTIFLANKGAIRVTTVAPGVGGMIRMQLDFSGTLYEYATLNMSSRNTGSYLAYVNYTLVGVKPCRIQLKDNAGNWIEFYKHGLGQCPECTDNYVNSPPDRWRKVFFPYGEGLEIKGWGANENDYWQYVAPAATFDWSNVETIAFSASVVNRPAGDYFIIDDLCIPTVEVISIEEDVPSQTDYGKRMLAIYRPDINSQVELDAYVLDEKAKYKDPLETIKITAIGETNTRYAGQSLQVHAPSHGIAALTRYRIVKLHHKLVKTSDESEVPGYTFLTEYDLIKHTINPTQVVDPNRFVVYGTSVDSILRDMRDKLIRLTKLSPVSTSGGGGGGGGPGGTVPYYISGTDVVFYDAYTMLRPETTGSIDLGSNAIQWGDIWGTVKYSDLHLLDVHCPKCRKPFKMNEDIKFVVTAVERLDSGGVPYDQIRCVPIHGKCPLISRLKRWFYKLLHRRTDEEAVY